MSVFVYYFTATPGPPTDLTVDEVEIHKIHLNWKRPNYFTVTGYQVETNQESGWKSFAKVGCRGYTNWLQVVSSTNLVSLLRPSLYVLNKLTNRK